MLSVVSAWFACTSSPGGTAPGGLLPDPSGDTDETSVGDTGPVDDTGPIPALPASCDASRPSGPWEPLGWPHGYAIGLAPDPVELDVLYLGTTTGLFWSPDAGVTWCALPFPAPPFLADLFAVAPTVPPAFFLAAEDGTVHRSDDYGRTWLSSRVPDAFPVYAWGLAVSADAATVLLRGSPDIRSGDGGASWSETEVDSGTVVFHPVDPDVAYKLDYYGDLTRSADAGTTWTPVTTPPVSGWFLAIGSDGKLFVSAREGLAVSSDDGASWALRDVGGRYGAMTAERADPSRVWMYAAPEVGESTNGGITWSWSTAGDNDYANYAPGLVVTRGGAAAVVVDDGLRRRDGAAWVSSGAMTPLAHSLLADGNHVFVGGSEVIARSVDGGLQFDQVAGIDRRNVSALVGTPADPDRLYASANDGLLRTDDGGDTWTDLWGGPQPSVATDAVDRDTVWAYLEPLAVSRDAGATWTDVADDWFLYGASSDPNASGHVYSQALGCGEPLVRSDDGFATVTLLPWHDIDTPLVATDGALWSCRVGSVAYGPWYGCDGYPVSPTVSLDRGETFIDVPLPTPTLECGVMQQGLPSPTVLVASLRDLDHMSLYAWRPAVGWTEVVADEFGAAVVDAADPDVAIIATDHGVFRVPF